VAVGHYKHALEAAGDAVCEFASAAYLKSLEAVINSNLAACYNELEGWQSGKHFAVLSLIGLSGCSKWLKIS